MSTFEFRLHSNTDTLKHVKYFLYIFQYNLKYILNDINGALFYKFKLLTDKIAHKKEIVVIPVAFSCSAQNLKERIHHSLRRIGWMTHSLSFI